MTEVPYWYPSVQILFFFTNSRFFSYIPAIGIELSEDSKRYPIFLDYHTI